MKYKVIIAGCGLFLASAMFACAQSANRVPKLHSASSQISVRKNEVKPGCEAACNHCSLRFLYSLQAEEKRLVSEPILKEVAERLNLAAKWQVDGAELYSMLKEKIRVEQYRGLSDIIRITAKSQDAAEAAAIANEVAQVFVDDVEEQSRQKKEIDQVAADKELKAQENLVQQLKRTVLALRKEHGLPEYLFGNDEAMQKLRMEQLKGDRVSAQKNLLVAEARLKRLSELNKKMEKTAEEMLKGLRAQCVIQKSKLNALDKELEKTSPIIKSLELIRVRAEYKTQNAVLDALKEKSFMIQHLRPSCSVEIIRRADPTPKNKPPSAFVVAKARNRQKDSAQKLFYATSRISVIKRPDELLKCKTPCEHCSLKPSVSLQTETVLIRWSHPVLDEVVQRMGLVEKWMMNGITPSPDEVRLVLMGKLATQQIGDSSFIDITAASSDVTEAISIANEVARSYKWHIEETMRMEKQRAEEALANVLKEQEDKVQEAELKYKEHRKKQGLSEIPVVLDKSQRQQMEEDRIKAKVAMLVAKAKLEQLSKLETTSEETKNEAEKTCLEVKQKFETLDQKRKAVSSQYENPETRMARIQLDTQKLISEALKKRVSEMPPVEEKPPRCTVEIVSLAQPEKTLN